MCRNSHPRRITSVLQSDKFSKSISADDRNKISEILTCPPELSKQSQINQLVTMTSGMCHGNCADITSVVSSSKNSTEMCPYCRSFQTDYKGNFMCSQLSKFNKMSRDTHHQAFPHLREGDSQLQKFSSRPIVGHVPFDLCRCAKTVTNTKNSSTTRSNYCSSTDGWRAFRVILVGILVVLPTPTMSSPINHSQRSGSPHSSGHTGHHHSPHRGNKGPMKWINPCRIPASIPTQPSEIHMQSQPDEEIFQNIITQARKAEVQARRFFDDFRRESFGNEHHNFEQLHYDWLKDIAIKVGKNLGEPVSQSRLETLEVEDILKSMYRGLQKLAVGLEQVVLDQSIHDGNFYTHFHEAEFQLKYVLCEFQIAMMEKNIQYEDVTREIMDRENFADISDRTVRNFRDFTIFRDYLNTLEFIQYSFEHFRNQAKQPS